MDNNLLPWMQTRSGSFENKVGNLFAAVTGRKRSSCIPMGCNGPQHPKWAQATSADDGSNGKELEDGINKY